MPGSWIPLFILPFFWILTPFYFPLPSPDFSFLLNLCLDHIRTDTHTIHRQRPKTFIFTVKSPVSHRQPDLNPVKMAGKWKKDNHDFSEVIKKIRLEKGLDQIQMAHEMGVETTTYRLWEWGRTYPHPKHSEAIRRLLGADIGLLKAKYTEFREKVWTSRQVSKMLGLNHHTLEDWLKKSNRFQPRYSVSGKRVIFTEKDIQEFKQKLGKRMKTIQIRRENDKTEITQHQSVSNQLNQMVSRNLSWNTRHASKLTTHRNFEKRVLLQLESFAKDLESGRLLITDMKEYYILKPKNLAK